MATYFTIAINGGAAQAAGALGVDDQSFVRARRIKAISTLSWRMTVADFTAAAVFAVGDLIEVRRGVTETGLALLAGGATEGEELGVRWFYGRVTEIPREAEGENEALTFVASCPWYWLDNVVFQQTTRAWDGSAWQTVPTSHVLIPFSRGATDWRVLTAEEQIAEAVRYVIEDITPAAPLQVGTVSIDPEGFEGGTLPLDEERDITPGQVITKMLRWAPDAAAWIDFSTSPPTFNCQRYAEMASVSLALMAGVVVAADITPLSQLQAPGIVLRFEKLNTISEGGTQGTVLQLTEQKWPEATTGEELGCLIQTIDLIGFKKTVQRAAVEVEAIAANSADWWKARVNYLQDPRIADIVVLEYIRESEDDLNLPNELVDGQIAPWMVWDENDNDDGVKSERVRLRARVTYKEYSDEAQTTLIEDLAASGRAKTITVELVSTDAVSREYSTEEFTQQQEPEPAGLARWVYEGLGVLHYQGSITILEAEIADRVNLGQRLNLTGGAAEWATMNAMIVAITDDVGRGTTSVQFGPPQYLRASEFMDFLRTNRNRLRSMSPNLPQSGQLDAGGSNELGKYLPVRNATATPGGGGGGESSWNWP